LSLIEGKQGDLNHLLGKYFSCSNDEAIQSKFATLFGDLYKRHIRQVFEESKDDDDTVIELLLAKFESFKNRLIGETKHASPAAPTFL
jgi:hypothetical protein